jgi:thioredoxin-related protein
MKILSVLIMSLFMNAAPLWKTDFNEAIQQAQQEHKYVLLSFSGSDWCIPCIKLHKEVFESEAFSTFATSKLELVNADFPRLKKNQLSKEQQKKNDLLADKYNPKGAFPYTVLLDDKGQVVKSWEGYPAVTPAQFTTQINTAMNARP